METAAWLLIIGLVFLIQILVMVFFLCFKVIKLESRGTPDVPPPSPRNGGVPDEPPKTNRRNPSKES